MANVRLRNVKKVYDKNVTAVQEFSLDIADKEFVVLVGPSGCGKSTTLRMVAGIEEITSGEIYIGDRLVNEVAPKDRDIAMVFQNYALYPHMTVFENMAFALKLRRTPKAEIESKVKEAAEILGITELLNRKPKALSGGQRPRVAIGRAIVRAPQVFLMDEPLSNLDAKLRNQMRTELIKLRQRIDTTFIYVTHDQTEAMTLGDRIVVMKDGFIQQIGKPREVFNEPANKFVAGFIGTPQMNFFPADLVLQNGKYAVQLYGVTLELPEERQRSLSLLNPGSQSVEAGIRPEHIQIVSEDNPNAVHAQVDVSELMGSEVYLHVNLQGLDAVIRTQMIEASEKYLFQASENRSVAFTFPESRIHLFDKESGGSLLAMP
jgi:multiple sugar transport system ATP-binding protein